PFPSVISRKRTPVPAFGTVQPPTSPEDARRRSARLPAAVVRSPLGSVPLRTRYIYARPVRTLRRCAHALRFMLSFDSLGLSKPILGGVRAAGYATPTPIQAATIPAALEGRDLIGCAQTGTGKTAAFVLPLLDRLVRSTRPGPRAVRALVVTPTRELALQVEQAVRTYGKQAPFYSLAIYGGVGIGPQLKALRRGVDVVVATPGRLLDHLDRGSLDLSRVEVLVLDEADRMFDMGFINDIRRIVKAVPAKRQTLLFSATMPP